MDNIETLNYFIVRDLTEAFPSSMPGLEAVEDDTACYRTLDAAVEAARGFLQTAMEGQWSTDRISASHLKNMRHEDFEGHPDIQDLLFDASRPLMQQFKGFRGATVEFRERSIEFKTEFTGAGAKVDAQVRYDIRLRSSLRPKTVTKIIDGVEFKAEVMDESEVIVTDWVPLRKRVQLRGSFSGFDDSILEDTVAHFPLYIERQTLTLRG